MKVLILGGTSDLGKSMASEYARQGYEIILTARNPEDLKTFQADQEIRFKTKVSVMKLDARDFDSHENFLHEAEIDSIDVVACVFGYLGEQKTAAENFEEARNIIETNFLGAVSLLNRIANVFESRKSGLIIGISSVAGERGRQSNYLYGSAKAGFSTYLDGLRNRLNPSGVHVCTVKPGFMATRMTEGLDLPGPLTAQPDEAAKVIIAGAAKGKNTIYVRWMWRYIMLIIRNIPEFIFKKMKM